MRELILSAKAKTWRMADRNFEHNDVEWSRLRTTVLQRDDYTCQFCEFRARQWQEVHHLDDDHNNDNLDNLVTACAFCHQVHHIGLAGLTDSAKLAWLPEMTQQEIHHMIRTKLVLAQWVSRQSPNAPSHELPGYAAAVQAIDSAIAQRCLIIKEMVGSDNPVVLGDALIAMSNDENYGRRGELLGGIRLVPTGRLVRGDSDKIPKMVDHWVEPSGPYAGMQPHTWAALLRQYQPMMEE